MIDLAAPRIPGCGGEILMSKTRKTTGAAPLASLAASRPVQTGSGWRDVFERLGNGTLPQPVPGRAPVSFCVGAVGAPNSRC